MKSSQIEWIGDNTIEISGNICEYSTFSADFSKFNDEVWIVFKDIVGINSCGVREWLNAIKKTNTKIHFVDVPAILMKQYSMIFDFFGTRPIIESFEVFYVCEQCEYEEQRILKVSEEISMDHYGHLTSPEFVCEKCNIPLIFDHDPNSYFFFLKNSHSV